MTTMRVRPIIQILLALLFALMALLILTTSLSLGQLSTVVSVVPVQSRAALSETVRISITVQDINDLGAFQLDLTYSPTLVRADAAELTDFLGSTGRNVAPLGPTIDQAAGRVTLGAFSFGGAPGPDGDGVLAVITLTTSLTPGVTALTLQNVQLLDTRANTLASALSNGQLIIGNRVPLIPSSPIPAHLAGAVPLTQTLQWQCSDPDEDPLTYTIAFGAHNPPPLMATGVTTTTYYPGDLTLNSTYYWIITATDGFSETAGPLWAFTTIGPPPAVDFTAIPRSGDVPLTVQFTSTPTNIGTLFLAIYAWDFGDGNTAAAANPTHTYQSAGSFNVTLMVTGPAGTAQAIKPAYITVYEPTPAPEVDFVGAPRSGDAPLTVHFTSTVTNTVTNYTWAFGDGGTSATANPTHTYTGAGSFGVSLVVTGPGGTAQRIRAAYITVNPPPSVPTATFVADVVSGLRPLTVTFTATTSGLVEGWLWTFGDGETAVTGPVISHAYQTPGVFDVSLTVSNTSGSYTINEPDYITVTEAPIPAPEVDFVGAPRSGDAPLTVQFTSTVTNAVTSYAWTFSDGGIATTVNPTHTYTSAGSFGVTLIVTGSGGTAQVIKPGYITVNPPAGAPTATFSADVVSGTAPLAITFTAVTSGTVEGWHWDFGDGETTATGPIAQHTYQTPGVFDVSLTVSNTHGSYTVSKLNYITVTAPPIPAPEVDFTAIPRSGDVPLDVQFTSVVTGEVTSYAWSFGDGGIATTANPTYTYSNAGSFSVSLVVTGPGGTVQAFKPAYITVNPPPGAPTATFSANVVSGTVPFAVTFTAVTSGTVEGWYWSFGDSTVAFTGPIVQHTYQIPGVFDVSLTVSNTVGSYIVNKPGYITVSSVGHRVYLPLVLRN